MGWVLSKAKLISSDNGSALDCSQQSVMDGLYSKMARPAMAKVTSIVGRHDLAAEIVHDTFVKLWQSKICFPNARAAYVWIYTTCHRASIDHLRSASRKREEYRDELPEVPAVASGSYADVFISKQQIRKYIDMLKPQEAEAFLYSVLDGMTQIEIAETMGLSRRTVQRLMAGVEETFKEIRHVPR